MRKLALGLGVSLVVLGVVYGLVPSLEVMTPDGTDFDPSVPRWQFSEAFYLRGGALARVRWQSDSWTVTVTLLRIEQLEAFTFSPGAQYTLAMASGKSGALDLTLNRSGTFVLGLRVIAGTGPWDVQPRVVLSRNFANLWPGSLVASAGVGFVLLGEILGQSKGQALVVRRPASRRIRTTTAGIFRPIPGPPPAESWGEAAFNPRAHLPLGSSINPPSPPALSSPTTAATAGCLQCGAPVGPTEARCPTCGFPRGPAPYAYDSRH